MPWLPPADPDSQELDCVLVFFPDRDEYRQALFGMLEELAQVWNWEADRETQEVIRQKWLEAEHCTLECNGYELS